MAKEFDPKDQLIVNCSEIEGFKDKVGRFVFRRPNNRDNLAIAVRASKLTESTELPVGFSNMAWVLATFSVVLEEKPKNIDFEDMYDMTPAYDLYERYNQWLETFRQVVSDEQETASKK